MKDDKMPMDEESLHQTPNPFLVKAIGSQTDGTILTKANAAQYDGLWAAWRDYCTRFNGNNSIGWSGSATTAVDTHHRVTIMENGHMIGEFYVEHGAGERSTQDDTGWGTPIGATGHFKVRQGNSTGTHVAYFGMQETTSSTPCPPDTP